METQTARRQTAEHEFTEYGITLFCPLCDATYDTTAHTLPGARHESAYWSGWHYTPTPTSSLLFACHDHD